MADFGPINTTEPRTFRAVCTAGAVEVFSSAFIVTPSADCAGEACVITANPISVTGQIGDTVVTGGQATGPVQWQQAATAVGPWTDTTQPTTITAANAGLFYRFCCQDDPTVCSSVIQLTVGACQITTQPVGVTGDVGDAISLGGQSSGPVQWQEATAAGGPWTDILDPPTVLRIAGIGLFYRFCCTDDPTICSNVVQVNTLPCRVLVEPNDAIGPDGTTIPTDMGGETTLPAQWQSSANAGGPWVNQAGPPTTISAATAGFWRFCCVEDLTVCSTVAEVRIDANAAPAIARSFPSGTVLAIGGGLVEEEYCLNNCQGTPTYRWQIRIDDPADAAGVVNPSGWQDVPAFDGQQCPHVFTRREELTTFNTADQTGLSDFTDTVTYYIRGSCDGGATWQPAVSLDISYDHPSDGGI